MFPKNISMGTIPTMENTSKVPIASNINLLLLLLRYSLDTVDYEDLELATKQDIDWGIFNKLIQFHKVSALIQNNISDMNFALLPPDTSNLLKQIHTNNVAVNLLLSTKITKIFETFKTQKIPILLIKGKAVENWLYDQYGIRSNGDIDLYIDSENWESAISCLSSMGYRMSHIIDRLTLNSKLSKQFIKSTKDVTFYGDHNVTIELHWRLSPNQNIFPLSFEEAWASKHVFDIRGTKIATLSKNIHAIYLSYHVTMHRMERLFWLYDIAQLMKNDNEDWSKILNQAKHLNSENSLSIACVAASKIFQIPIPTALIQQENILNIGERLSISIIPDVLSENPIEPSSTKSLLKKISWRRHINPSQSSFFSEWFKFLTTPSIHDWESIKLPDCLTPLYRVWRPLRLTFKGLTKPTN